MSQQAYLHKLFVRKHLIAVLRSSPTALVAFRHLPLRVWRAWTPDQEDCLADIPDAMTALGLQELLGGVPAQLAACWACLLLPVRRMAPEAQALWRDPRERPHMILVAAEYRSLYGVAPTPALLTQLVLRNRQANRQAAMRAPLATPGAPTDLGGAAAAEPAEPAMDALVARPTRTCECTGNCDSKCPARRGKGWNCPNLASVNLGIHHKLITGEVYRGRRPLCQHCVCQHAGCSSIRRAPGGPYCYAHQKAHPGAERVTWQLV